MERTKKMWFKCTPDEHVKVKAMAKEKGLTVTDLVLSTLLGIEILPVTETNKTPYIKVVNSRGEERTYYKEYSRKKKGRLKPPSEAVPIE